MTIIAYILLYAAVLALWVPSHRRFPLWIPVFILSLIFAWLSHRINILALGAILLFSLFVYAMKKTSSITRILSAAAVFILGVFLEGHLIPGFNNLQVLHNVFISQDAIPFNLYLNFDKTSVGIIILGLLCSLVNTKKEWIALFKTLWPWTLLTLCLVGILSLSFHYVIFDPKLPDSLWIWLITNLLFVCVAEEAFFRGFIQQFLCKLLKCHSYGYFLGIFIAGVLFGLAHFPGGLKYIILATIAGIGYGWVYYRTGRIEASILTHFSVNLLHFLFFTYPALSA